MNKNLTEAAKSGDVGKTKLYLLAGANVHQKDSEDFTALHWAAKRGNLRIVKLLVDYSADIEATTKNGSSPLHLASYEGHIDIVKILLEHGAKVNATEEWSHNTALHCAALGGHLDVIRLLLDFSADVDAKNYDADLVEDMTALHIAASFGYKDVVELLIARGADLDAKTADNCTTLHCATLNGQAEVVSYLLECGANVGEKDMDSGTVLHWAADEGNPEIVKILLQHGADVGAKDKNGCSAFHFASNESKAQDEHEDDRQVEIVKLLLDYGSNAEEAVVADSKMSLEVAKEKGNSTLVQVIEQYLKLHKSGKFAESSAADSSNTSTETPDNHMQSYSREQNKEAVVVSDAIVSLRIPSKNNSMDASLSRSSNTDSQDLSVPVAKVHTDSQSIIQNFQSNNNQSQGSMTLAVSSPTSKASNNPSQGSVTPFVSSPASKASNNQSQGIVTPTVSSPTFKASNNQSQESMTLEVSSPTFKASNNQSQESMALEVSSPTSKASKNQSQGIVTPTVSSPISRASEEPLRSELESPNRSNIFYSSTSSSVLSPIAQNSYNSNSNQDTVYGSSPSFHVLDVHPDASSILSPTTGNKIHQTILDDEINDNEISINSSEILLKTTHENHFSEDKSMSFQNKDQPILVHNTVVEVAVMKSSDINADIKMHEQRDLKYSSSVSHKSESSEKYISTTNQDLSASSLHSSSVDESAQVAKKPQIVETDYSTQDSGSNSCANNIIRSDSHLHSQDTERITDEEQITNRNIVKNMSEGENENVTKEQDNVAHSTTSNPTHEEPKKELKQSNHNQCCTIS